MKSSYLDLLKWLSENESLGYWITFFLASFILLLLAYLFMCNIRLHMHIRTLMRDKGRLMQEKDLMRKGLENSQPAPQVTQEESKTETPQVKEEPPQQQQA